MNVAEFDYDLPNDRIALFPPTVRGEAKLLVIDRANHSISHSNYPMLLDLINPGDLVVLNDTKVLPARLFPLDADGNSREMVVLEKHHYTTTGSFQAIIRGKVEVGSVFTLGDYRLEVVENAHGVATVTTPLSIEDLTTQYGQIPIPPYLKRMVTSLDTERYQTEFATFAGSVAAPTASLNFTKKLAEAMASKGISIAFATLHVGLGTFQPIRTEQLDAHRMHQESYRIPRETIELIKKTKANGHKVYAIGTTITRALEHAGESIFTSTEDIQAEADIFIYPGYQFKVIDGLVTNFHAPRSTVLMLTAAFAGKELLMQAYTQALESDYRFLSYGDSMLIY